MKTQENQKLAATSVVAESTPLKKPDWLRVRFPSSPEYFELKSRAAALNLHTVCQEAKCPNIAECWKEKTLTVMIMGDTCTRFCKFCHVKTGNPKRILDAEEPLKTAKLLQPLNLNYVVITAVDRDDLPDGGAQHFAATISATRSYCPSTMIEVLTGDFAGDANAIKTVVAAKPDVISHNVETVPRLTPGVRDRRANFDQSVNLLWQVKTIDPLIFTKSSIMVGLGETEQEVYEVMDTLRSNQVDFFTIGQYLQPTRKHLPVVRYITPALFDHYQQVGMEKGFRVVISGPLVRSSYRAGEFLMQQVINAKKNK